MSNDPVSSFGEIIAAERKRKGWTLAKLSEQVATENGATATPQYLNDIEHGRRLPSNQVIESLATALGIKKDVLFHLAGKLAPDMPSKDLSAKKIEEAYKAFRRTLKS